MLCSVFYCRIKYGSTIARPLHPNFPLFLSSHASATHCFRTVDLLLPPHTTHHTHLSSLHFVLICVHCMNTRYDSIPRRSLIALFIHLVVLCVHIPASSRSSRLVMSCTPHPQLLSRSFYLTMFILRYSILALLSRFPTVRFFVGALIPFVR